MINIISIFQLIALFIVCFITSYTDIKYGKIKNTVIVVSLVFALLSDLLIFIFVSRQALYCFCLNAVTLVVIGIVLYLLHIWAGGDCKLIIAISLLYPCKYYWNINQTNITLWIFLSFTFITGFLYIFIQSIILCRVSLSKKSLFSILKKIKLNIKTYFIAIIYLSAISHLYIIFIFPYINISQIIYFCICVCVLYLLHKINIYFSKYLIISVFIFDVLMTLITKNLTVSIEWKTYLLVIVIMIIRVFVENYNYKTISVNDINEGMIISRQDTVYMQQSNVHGLPEISDETLKSRLTSQEVVSINRWATSKFGLSTIRIVRKIPFAIFISLGIFIYVILGRIV